MRGTTRAGLPQEPLAVPQAGARGARGSEKSPAGPAHLYCIPLQTQFVRTSNV
jgi:hypothetical protein